MAVALLCGAAACSAASPNAPDVPTAPTVPTVPAPTPSQTGITLSGHVSAAFPNTKTMAGATVQIVGGSSAGTFVMSDATGNFRFEGLAAGTVDLRVSMDGFTSWTLSELKLTQNEDIDPVLFPTPPTNSAGARATAQCNDAAWTWSDDRALACQSNGGIAWGVCPGPICDAIRIRIR